MGNVVVDMQPNPIYLSAHVITFKAVPATSRNGGTNGMSDKAQSPQCCAWAPVTDEVSHLAP